MTQTSQSGRRIRAPAEVTEAQEVNLGSGDWGRLLCLRGGGLVVGGGGGVMRLGRGVEVTGNSVRGAKFPLVSDGLM